MGAAGEDCVRRRRGAHLQQHAVRVLPLRNRHAALPPRVVFVRVRGDAGDALGRAARRVRLRPAVRRANPRRLEGARRERREAEASRLGFSGLGALEDHVRWAGVGAAGGARVFGAGLVTTERGHWRRAPGKERVRRELRANLLGGGRPETRPRGRARHHRRLRPHAGVHGALRGVWDALAGAVRRHDQRGALLRGRHLLRVREAAGEKVKDFVSFWSQLVLAV